MCALSCPNSNRRYLCFSNSSVTSESSFSFLCSPAFAQPQNPHPRSLKFNNLAENTCSRLFNLLWFFCMAPEHFFRPREQKEVQPMSTMAREALKLASQFEKLPDAVFQVLTNHHIQDMNERTRLFGAIMREINKNKPKKTAALKRDQHPAPEFVVTSDILRDARTHELQQPRSTWDPNHPENSP